jgi:hypothetical protein
MRYLLLITVSFLPSNLSPPILAFFYAGPETILPAVSWMAAIVGLLLLIWRRIVVALTRSYVRLKRLIENRDVQLKRD